MRRSGGRGERPAVGAVMRLTSVRSCSGYLFSCVESQSRVLVCASDNSATRPPTYGRLGSPGVTGTVSRHLSTWIVASCQTVTAVLGEVNVNSRVVTRASESSDLEQLMILKPGVGSITSTWTRPSSGWRSTKANTSTSS